MQTLKIKTLTPTARVPRRATPYSAGYDLYADVLEPLTILPGETKLVGTGIALEPPAGDCAGFLFARSSLASRFGIAPANCVGVIDADYRGEVLVPLHNFGRDPFVLNPGDRFAQLVFLPVCMFETQLVQTLDETSRGAGGFGSTGRR